MTAHLPNAEYAALLRQGGTATVQVTQMYLTALTLVRQICRTEGLSDADKLAEIGLVFSAIERAQEDLDAAEDVTR